jgi:hypothetical protein
MPGGLHQRCLSLSDPVDSPTLSASTLASFFSVKADLKDEAGGSPVGWKISHYIGII